MNYEYKGYELVVRLARLLFEGENTCLTAMGRNTFHDAFPDRVENTERGEVGKLADAWIDQLVTLRVIADSRAIPLIADDDADTITGIVQDRGEVGSDVIPRLHKMLRIKLYTFAIGLLVVGEGDPVGGGDEYDGCHITARAISTAAIELNVNPAVTLNPKNALEATEFRSAAFRHCMSPERWQIFM